MEIAVKAHKQKRKCTTEAERDARMRARLDSMGTSVKSTGGSRQSQGREVDARLARVQRPTSTSHSGGRDEQRSRPKAKNSKASTDTTEMQARMQARLDSMGTSVKTAGGSRQKETDKPAAQSSKASASSVRNRGSPQSGQQLQHTKKQETRKRLQPTGSKQLSEACDRERDEKNGTLTESKEAGHGQTGSTASGNRDVAVLKGQLSEKERIVEESHARIAELEESLKMALESHKTKTDEITTLRVILNNLSLTQPCS